MGKWINLEQRYSCDMKTFRDLFCLSTSFHETFHKIRKDEGKQCTLVDKIFIWIFLTFILDVVVTDWMQTTNVTQQRLCFFNMYIDKFGNNNSIIWAEKTLFIIMYRSHKMRWKTELWNRTGNIIHNIYIIEVLTSIGISSCYWMEFDSGCDLFWFI